MQRIRRAKTAKKGVSHTNLSEIISLVFVMGQFMKEKMHKKLDHGHCTLLEFEALRYVEAGERPLMSDIARKFHVTPPAATLLIDGLVKQKMLERFVDPADRRSVHIGLTRKGKQLLELGMARRVRELKKVFGVLTPAERTQFAAILKKITKTN